MSNLVLPSLSQPGQVGKIWPIKRTPVFDTIVMTPATKRGEVRTSLTPVPVWDYEFDLNYIKGDLQQTTETVLQQFVDFYMRMHGAQDDWLFQDPYDCGMQIVPIFNGNFEVSATIPPPGWPTKQLTGSLSYDTTTQYDGVRSLIITSTAGVGSIASQFYPASAGQVVTVQAWTKNVTASGNEIELQWSDSSGNPLGSVLSATSSLSSFVQLTATGTAPAGTAYFNIILIVGATGSAEFDDVTAFIVMGGNELIGYGNGITTTFQAGRGVGNFSFEPLQVFFPSNVSINGVTVPPGPQSSGNQWYSGLENWITYSQQTTQAAWIKNSVTMLDNQVAAPDGTTTAAKLTQVGTAGNSLAQIIVGGPVAGDTVTFSCWLLQGTAGFQCVLRFDFIDSTGTVIQSLQGSLLTTTATWIRSSLTTTVPLGTTEIQASVFIPSGKNANSNFVYVWGLQLERWNTPTSYVVTTSSAPISPRGVITFAIAPAAQTLITITGQYFFRCKFLDDEWNDLEEFLYQIWSLKSLKFRTILL